jgi:hypothetical protein
MKQSRRSFFSIIAGALLIGVPGLQMKAAAVRGTPSKLALVCHRLGWEEGLTGRPARHQFRSIAAARKAGYSDDLIVVPPSHIEPPENKYGPA